jgi:hypothetical protein
MGTRPPTHLLNHADEVQSADQISLRWHLGGTVSGPTGRESEEYRSEKGKLMPANWRAGLQRLWSIIAMLWSIYALWLFISVSQSAAFISIAMLIGTGFTASYVARGVWPTKGSKPDDP